VFASFCKTPEALKRLPAGWSRKDNTKRFVFDPKPVWEMMRRQKIVTVGGHRE
jgi:hypothetical protein